MRQAIPRWCIAYVHLLLLILPTAVHVVAFSHPNVPTTSVELPPGDLPLSADVERALAAVRRACSVTEQLQPEGGDDPQEINTVEKKDLSPVTVADFAVQALILDALHEEYPNDGYIAEENSESLLHDATLCSQVTDAAGFESKERTIKAIDLGKSYEKWGVGETTSRPRRVWCLDPIDGTRGFLRGRKTGGQYAIALALIEDGVPVIGILGCPNLPVDDVGDSGSYAWSNDEEAARNPMHRGCVFVASKNGGSFQLPVTLGGFEPRRLHVTKDRPVSRARFCIGVERFSDAAGQCAGMAQELHGIENALDGEHGDIVLATRMDSQAKHGVIARGGAELYARLPKPGYVEWIWDHAAGKVVVEEAGGKMTDVDGRELDFSLGAHLSSSVKGVLMSCGGETHQALVKAYAVVNGSP